MKATKGPTCIDVDAALASLLRFLAPSSQATAESSFTQDLGLDSLDAVEVVMAIEEEFSIEIPDEDVRRALPLLAWTAQADFLPSSARPLQADAITTVGQAIDYISRTPEGEYLAIQSLEAPKADLGLYRRSALEWASIHDPLDCTLKK